MTQIFLRPQPSSFCEKLAHTMICIAITYLRHPYFTSCCILQYDPLVGTFTEALPSQRKNVIGTNKSASAPLHNIERRLELRCPITYPPPSCSMILRAPKLDVPVRAQPIRPQRCVADNRRQRHENPRGPISIAIPPEVPNARRLIHRGCTVPIIRLIP